MQWTPSKFDSAEVKLWNIKLVLPGQSVGKPEDKTVKENALSFFLCWTAQIHK